MCYGSLCMIMARTPTSNPEQHPRTTPYGPLTTPTPSALRTMYALTPLNIQARSAFDPTCYASHVVPLSIANSPSNPLLPYGPFEAARPSQAKAFDDQSFVDVKSDVCIIPPNSFALARTVEYFRIPRQVLTLCLGKSTYARCGIIVNVTPLEPEWEGHVTLEFSNTTPLPAKIYANEGVAQFIFLESDDVCETSYKDRKGKYQGQKGVTLPKT